MNLISRDELKEKLDRGDDFKLAMVLGDWAFQAKHIPGSLNIAAPQAALEAFDPGDEIVVYCSDPNCIASKVAYQRLTDRGYTNARRYAGGLIDWEEVGFLLEGSMAS